MLSENGPRIRHMLALDLGQSPRSDHWFDLYGPFAILAVIIILVILVYLREGRHPILEQIVARSDFGSPAAFQGTLAVEEYRSSIYLRLSKSTREARAWQFWYRWLVGIGRQPNFDEVTFDASRQEIKLTKEEKHTMFGFSEVSAIRVRERGAGKNGGSLWYLELVSRVEKKAVPFATSASGDRQTMFERSAAVAKAAALIVSVPVQVVVAGNVWTAGWPPKEPVTTP
jgi:hypothetical protein